MFSRFYSNSSHQCDIPTDNPYPRQQSKGDIDQFPFQKYFHPLNAKLLLKVKSMQCHWFSIENKEIPNEKMLLYYLIKWQSNSSQITHMLHWCCLPSSHYQSTSTWSLQAWHCPQLQVMKESLSPFHFVSRLQRQLWSCWCPRYSFPPPRLETSSLRWLSWRPADPRSTFLPPTYWRIQSILIIWISLDGDSWHSASYPAQKIYSDL